MKYTIDELTPNEGITKKQMAENGEYVLYQVYQSDNLEETLVELHRLMKAHGTRSDFDLKIDGEPILVTIDNVLMFD